jgi:hypothetical protein
MYRGFSMCRFLGVIMAVGLMAGGCSPQPVKQAASRLRTGMDRASVDNLFADVGRIISSGDYREPPRDIVVLDTNSPPRAYVVYGDRRGYVSLWENCTVWFGTNGTVVAYRYEVMN